MILKDLFRQRAPQPRSPIAGLPVVLSALVPVVDVREAANVVAPLAQAPLNIHVCLLFQLLLVSHYLFVDVH